MCLITGKNCSRGHNARIAAEIAVLQAWLAAILISREPRTEQIAPQRPIWEHSLCAPMRSGSCSDALTFRQDDGAEEDHHQPDINAQDQETTACRITFRFRPHRRIPEPADRSTSDHSSVRLQRWKNIDRAVTPLDTINQNADAL
jgi:hypothetical protein